MEKVQEQEKEKQPEVLNNEKLCITIKLTEWERHALIESIKGCRYPGTHIDIMVNLLDKLKKAPVVVKNDPADKK